jgi:hypothetical protein
VLGLDLPGSRTFSFVSFLREPPALALAVFPPINSLTNISTFVLIKSEIFCSIGFVLTAFFALLSN